MYMHSITFNCCFILSTANLPLLNSKWIQNHCHFSKQKNKYSALVLESVCVVGWYQKQRKRKKKTKRNKGHASTLKNTFQNPCTELWDRRMIMPFSKGDWFVCRQCFYMPWSAISKITFLTITFWSRLGVQHSARSEPYFNPNQKSSEVTSLTANPASQYSPLFRRFSG